MPEEIKTMYIGPNAAYVRAVLERFDITERTLGVKVYDPPDGGPPRVEFSLAGAVANREKIIGKLIGALVSESYIATMWRREHPDES